MENKEEMLKIERSIGYILRIGVIVSATIILIGMILLFFQPATGQAPLNSLTLIMHELVRIKRRSVCYVGAFLLDFNTRLTSSGINLCICEGKGLFVCFHYDHCADCLSYRYEFWFSRKIKVKIRRTIHVGRIFTSFSVIKFGWSDVLIFLLC